MAEPSWQIKALRERQDWLHVALSNIGDAVIATDAEGRVSFLNSVAEFLTGWTQADAAGQPVEVVFQIINRDTRHTAESPSVRVLRDGAIGGLANHTLLTNKNGTERTIDGSAAPIRCKQGEIVGCVLVVHDITDRREIERVIADARAYSENIVDTVREPLLVLDARLRVVTASRSFCQTFHVTPAETQGQFIYDLGSRQWDIPALRKLLEEVLPQNTQFNDYEVEHDFPDIGHRFMLLNARRIYREGNHTELILLAIEDITERRALEQQNAKNTQTAHRLASIVESSDDAIIGKSLDGIIQSWNAAAERLFGYTAEQAVGRSITMLIPADRLDEEDRIIATLRAGERVDHFDTVRMRSDGQPAHVSLTISPIRDEAGRIVGASKIARDITERKRLEDQLRQYAADLSEADRRKNEFLAMLAHELRNPLAPIRNAVQVLRLAKGGGEVVRSASELMDRQINQMVRLVDDLLDVSRISRGKTELKRGRVELASVIHLAVEAARSLYESRGHDMTVTMPPQPIYLNADPTRLAQVVGNLLNNACKFTDNGGHISLTVKRVGSEVAIRVRDDGIGIAADQLPRIFDMFMQVDTSLERSVSGLGIGLTLVKSLVEMHDGTVEVQSAGSGQGSEFVVRLPVMAEPSKLPVEPTVSEPPPTTTARRILVVDDNRDSAESLSQLLEITGNKTHTAYDGEVAVEVAARVRPDVILMDIGLPKLNGYEACRRIREQTWSDGMVLVALTGWGQEEDRQKSKEAGFNGHLVKPVDYTALTKMLAELQPTV